jgi:hypothetical protein
MAKKIKNYVGIALDESGSMMHLKAKVLQQFNTNAGVIRERSIAEKQDTRVSVYTFGGYVRKPVQEVAVTALSDLDSRDYNPAGQTPLFDAVGQLIEDFDGMKDADDDDTSFMILIITDGEENSSRRFSGTRIRELIAKHQKTDRWTFAFLVPPYAKNDFCRRFGIPEGNVQEWEATERGVELAFASTRSAYTNYFTARSKGLKSTQTFFTDMSGVKAQTVKAKLAPIDRREVKVLDVHRESIIREFVEKELRKSMLKGAAFYQLVKTEKKVQDYKTLIIREKKTGDLFTGAQARTLLGLPHNGDVKIVPGNHGAYDIFVQSTSVNRKLPPGTQVLYWEKVGTPFTEGPSSWR